ncbi:MAG: DNA polymerase/3'-5' exonuclease PolX [Acidobacteria bacterium]|jgi:DNA polymerase (family 10)|nr:DNA polymerase/3'-5' exonuclease PolX [Acidobacteriota bacterium]
MENGEIVRLLCETADLLEIAGEDPFRVRSYRNAAQSLETFPEKIDEIVRNPDRKAGDKQLLAISGIGKGMVANLREICATGDLDVHQQLLQKFPPGALEMLRIQGLGPKGIALIWSAYRAANLDELEQLCREGKLRLLPRMGEKLEQKILKSIEAYRRSAGRFLISAAERASEEIVEYLRQGPDADQLRVTCAGSLRRGKETIGDLDLLVTGGRADEQIEHLLKYPKVLEVIARGENKVSVRLPEAMQVDVRFLEPGSYGAAMQYFTGSKEHNVSLRGRAIRMGFKLSEYGLFRADDEHQVAGGSEEEIYTTLGLDYIAPELRENWGEIEAAAEHRLPRLVEPGEIQGDLHMHTSATDGRLSIREMAEAARARGLRYIAITDHSKALAMTNGLDERRLLEQIKEIRQVNSEMEGFRILAGIEVDIHRDGRLDLNDEALAQLDIVVASVHSYMQIEPEEMTDRLLRAFENRYLNVLAHPTGRQLLSREPYRFDMERILGEAAKRGIHLEINSSPERLDLNEQNARRAKEKGVKLVISTDAHHTRHLPNIKFGVKMARRAWLEAADVLNTLPAEQFLQALRRAD